MPTPVLSPRIRIGFRKDPPPSERLRLKNDQHPACPAAPRHRERVPVPIHRDDPGERDERDETGGRSDRDGHRVWLAVVQCGGHSHSAERSVRSVAWTRCSIASTGARSRSPYSA